jgi:hypothetical protein
MVDNQGQPRPAFKLEGNQARMVLLIGGLLGVVLLLVGVVLAGNWWTYITGGIEEWHKHGWNILLIELCVFGGLALMFGVLQLVRSEERASASTRRMLYGYNAVLASLLLVTVLAHVNVLSYIQFSVWPFRYLNALHGTYDWTQSTIFTLNPQSKELLEKLQKPVKVYVMLPLRDEFVSREVRTLMDNCRAVNNKIEVESLSPDLDQTRILELSKKYQIPEREGMLVVYGTEPDEKYEFIRYNDIFSIKEPGFQNPNEKRSIQFTGESALITKLEFLQGGKEKSVVYFTQDDGELDLNNQFDEHGVGTLKGRLERLNYEVKPLKLGTANPEVPDDAAVVVVALDARRTLPFSDASLKALRDYMKPSDPKKKKGKLIILFDVIKNPDGSMEQTGLEKLVQEFGVQVGNERLVSANPRLRDPLDVLVLADPNGHNPAVAVYRENGYSFPMHEVRTVEASHTPGASPEYQVETILLAHPQSFMWKEANLNTDVVTEVQGLRKRDRLDELQKKISQEPLPVAVAVSEQGPAAAEDAGDPHAFMHRGEQQPRMIVFGDATWVDNKHMGDAGEFDLFTGSLAWLRERPDIGKLEPKERKPFFVKSGNAEQLSWYMFYLPAILVMVGIVGLGANIWVVRRR